jgi:uncharacterized phage protein (TIGR01671 family)
MFGASKMKLRMRDIKFRGKTCHSDEWRYGSLITMEDEDSVHIVEPKSQDIVQDGHHLRQDSDRPTWVIPKTVGQYTGYTDKNGSEIYAGDIVVDENRQTAYVAWLPQECGFVLVYEKYDSRLGHRNRGSGYSFDENLEIISNIHDNPDLVSWLNKQKENK